VVVKITVVGYTVIDSLFASDFTLALARDQSLLINAYTTESNLEILLDLCDDYMISSKLACSIICQVKESMCSWSKLSTSIGLFLAKQGVFKEKFNLFTT